MKKKTTKNKKTFFYNNFRKIGKQKPLETLNLSLKQFIDYSKISIKLEI